MTCSCISLKLVIRKFAECCTMCLLQLLHSLILSTSYLLWHRLLILSWYYTGIMYYYYFYYLSCGMVLYKTFLMHGNAAIRSPILSKSKHYKYMYIEPTPNVGSCCNTPNTVQIWPHPIFICLGRWMSAWEDGVHRWQWRKRQEV